MTRAIQQIVREERGAAFIEMGLALPILTLMLVGMVDISQGYSTKLQLEQAAQRTLEQVQQKGYTHPTDLALLKTEAEEAAGAGATATTSAYLECWDGGTRTTAAFTSTCAAGSSSARYVSISITKNYAPIIGYQFPGANEDGTVTLLGEAAIRVQ